MAFGYCVWAINDFVYAFFIAHLSGNHNVLFTSGQSVACVRVAPTLAIEFIHGGGGLLPNGAVCYMK